MKSLHIFMYCVWFPKDLVKDLYSVLNVFNMFKNNIFINIF